jgi:hypothetical protein
MRIYVRQARRKSRRGRWIQDPTIMPALPPIIGTENTHMNVITYD